MVAIQIFAIPAPKVRTVAGIVHVQYHVANIYRGRNRYKVIADASLYGLHFVVSGSDKPTGWEPYCSKWADRFQTWSKKIGWGYSWVTGLIMTELENEIAEVCDRLQVVVSRDRSEELKTLRKLSWGNNTQYHKEQGYKPVFVKEYAQKWVKLETLRKSGWVKTINIK